MKKRYLLVILVLVMFFISGCELFEENPQFAMKYKMALPGGGGGSGGGSSEICDGIDNDEDGRIDEGFTVSEDLEITFDRLCPEGEGCSLGTCIPYDAQCENILDNGPNTIKLILISDGYVEESSEPEIYDFDDFDLHANNFIFDEILNVEPYSHPSPLFSFYKVKTTFPIGCGLGEEYACRYENIIDLVEYCVPYSNKTDAIIFSEHGGNPGFCFSSYLWEGLYFNFGNMAAGRGSIPLHLLHEYSHCYWLADEYYIDQEHSWIDAPNCDVEGCPDWCSGEINTSAPCYSLVQEYLECASENPGEAWINCLFPLGPEVILNCDVGIDCNEDVKCLFMCGGSSGYRELESSLMNDKSPVLSPSSIDHLKYGLSERMGCYDSDGGLNYYTFGETIGHSNDPPELFTQEDCCYDMGESCVDNSEYLLETHCDGIYKVFSIFECPLGCSNGKCLRKGSKIIQRPMELP